MIADYQKEELGTRMRLGIAADRASIRSTDGNGITPSKAAPSLRRDVELSHRDPGYGREYAVGHPMVGDRILVFSRESEMSDFVWERV